MDEHLSVFTHGNITWSQIFLWRAQIHLIQIVHIKAFIYICNSKTWTGRQ